MQETNLLTTTNPQPFQRFQFNWQSSWPVRSEVYLASYYLAFGVLFTLNFLVDQDLSPLVHDAEPTGYTGNSRQ
jgi:hypothetical protein